MSTAAAKAATARPTSTPMARAPQEPSIEIYVKTMSGKTVTLTARQDRLIDQILWEAHRESAPTPADDASLRSLMKGVVVGGLRLVLTRTGQQLEPDLTLSDENIGSGTVLHTVLRKRMDDMLDDSDTYIIEQLAHEAMIRVRQGRGYDDSQVSAALEQPPVCARHVHLTTCVHTYSAQLAFGWPLIKANGLDIRGLVYERQLEPNE